MDVFLKYETDLFCCTDEIGDGEARPRLSFLWVVFLLPYIILLFNLFEIYYF